MAFEGIRLGGPVDDVLAKGGECRPGNATGELARGTSSLLFAQNTFGYALSHHHAPRDSNAIHRALGVGTICWATLGTDMRAFVGAVDRRVVAVIVYFWNDGDFAAAVPADSVRRRAYAAWGRPTHHASTLDTWSSRLYRSYFLVPQAPPAAPAWVRAPRLIMLDIAACTAFDRRAHRAGATGEVGAC
ncbi:MAG: hypothetical protein ACREME_13325 [Gemmatimonadales bacterium]